MRIARWHVEGEAYDRALSMVVEAQAALPMAAVWGTGANRLERRPVLPGRRPRRSAQPGQRPLRNRTRRHGVLARLRPLLPVRHADHPRHRPRSPLHPRRSADERDRAGASASSNADTGGFTDHVFAACSIFGYTFVPRIRDLPSKRLYVFERAGVPKQLRPLVGGKVNADLIDRNWADILRVGATMAAGTMRPSQISGGSLNGGRDVNPDDTRSAAVRLPSSALNEGRRLRRRGRVRVRWVCERFPVIR